MNRTLIKQCQELWNAGKIQTSKPGLISQILGVKDVKKIANPDPNLGPFSGRIVDDPSIVNEEYFSHTVQPDDLFTYIITENLMISFDENEFFYDKFKNFDKDDPLYFYVYYNPNTRIVHFSVADSEKITDMYAYQGFAFIAQNADRSLFKLQKMS